MCWVLPFVGLHMYACLCLGETHIQFDLRTHTRAHAHTHAHTHTHTHTQPVVFHHRPYQMAKVVKRAVHTKDADSSVSVAGEPEEEIEEIMTPSGFVFV